MSDAMSRMQPPKPSSNRRARNRWLSRVVPRLPSPQDETRQRDRLFSGRLPLGLPPARRPDRTAWPGNIRLGGELLGLVQDQIERGENVFAHRDQPDPNGVDTPVARLDPALSPQPKRATRAQTYPPRKIDRSRFPSHGQDATDGHQHVVVLGEGGKGAFHPIDPVTDLLVMLHIQGAMDARVAFLVGGTQGCRGHRELASNGLLQVRDVRLDFSGRRLAGEREILEGVKGVDSGPA